MAFALPSGAQEKKPNILVIWGDDIGTWNISHNTRGMMGYKTPNIDRIAALQDLRDTIIQEHKALTRELDQVSLKVVDRAFLRAAQLCVAALAAAFLGVVVLLFIVRWLFPQTVNAEPTIL